MQELRLAPWPAQPLVQDEGGDPDALALIEHSAQRRSGAPRSGQRVD
jgi:hypothetical protein